jgi:hypothetical protein
MPIESVADCYPISSSELFFQFLLDAHIQGETIGAVVQPLPTSHLIFRAPTNAAGKCWMDALELALRYSGEFPAKFV